MKLSVPLTLVFCLALPAAAATFVVDSDADAPDAHPGDGICASASSGCTLRAAIMEANALAGLDLVLVPSGYYRLTLAGAGEDAGATGDLDITADLALTGAGAGVTVIDGAGLDRVFDVLAPAVTIGDVTVQGGSALGAGASFGGGVASRGALTLDRCVFTGNRANTGGALDSSGSLFLRDVTIDRNETVDAGFGAPGGAGIHAQGSVQMISCTLSRNRTATSGAADGGGLWADGASLTATNSTFSGNGALAGGGLYARNGDVLLVNTTFAGNSEAISYFSPDASHKLRVRNSLVANSFGGANCSISSGALVVEGADLDTDTSCGFGGAFSGVDPRIGALEDDGGITRTVPLLPDSPVIEAGKACTDAGGGALTHDQRNAIRPGATCSLGAYQLVFGETFSATRTIPIVLDVTGATGARFTSELTLANRGTTRSTVRLTYKAAPALNATGSGTVLTQLGPGAQVVIADAISYLRGRGLEIPSGNQGGTLRVDFFGLSTGDAGFAGARTTSPSGSGRAGLAYPGPKAEDSPTQPLRLFGLRETADDRTNLALANPGLSSTLKLRVTLHSGTSGQSASSFTLPDVTLHPGEWTQINAPQLLRAALYTNAWATVERVSGTDPFLAYAVFNDNVTSDGSYVTPVPAVQPVAKQLVPVLVETATFESELVLANPGESAVKAKLVYVQSLGSTTGLLGTVSETLQPHEQRIIPGAIDYLRGKGLPVGARGNAGYVGTLSVSFETADGADADGFAGARTAAPSTSGGRYGLFYPAVPLSETANVEAWIYGLEQNDTARSNLALVNAGKAQTSTDPVTLRYDVYDGATGQLAGSRTRTLDPGGWTQINAVLGDFGLAKGYVHVVKTAGSGRFLAYGVVNDGKDPGSGTNDGSYVAMTVVE